MAAPPFRGLAGPFGAIAQLGHSSPDRVIRVEERIRLAAILPEPLRSRIGELSDSQIVGPRFASDAELPALFQRAIDEKAKLL